MKSSGLKISSCLLLAGVTLSMATCGGPGDSVEVTEVQTRSPYRPEQKLDASTEERFQYALQSGEHSENDGHDHGDAGEQKPSLHWELPEGWKEVATTEMRPVNLRFGDNSEGECYVTLLSGGGGGAFANVNRWRAQMGLAALSESEFDALPAKTFLNQEAVFLDIEGTFSGMGGTAKEGYRLLGLVAESQDEGIFVKMVGPKNLVADHESNFDSFLASLHSGEGHDHGTAASLPDDHPPIGNTQASGTPAGAPASSLPDGHPAIGSNPVAAAPAETPSNDSAEGIAWAVPEGWQKGGQRSMRLVTYTAASAECYITVLNGDGGGLMMNVNRWFGQLGQPPIDEEGLSALPEISVFGSPSALIEIMGSYGGMSGEKAGGQALLGAISLQDGRAIFVKMTGPEADIAAEKENFISFCESLHLQ